MSVLLLPGNGKGFCGGYDLVQSAEGQGALEGDGPARRPAGSPLDPAVMRANHDPGGTWDPTVDYAMMSRNVRAFMSLFHCGKPVVCKVHGFCVAGGTDMALCSDLLVIAADAKIGYPPARVWGSPTTSLWAYRLDRSAPSGCCSPATRCRAPRRLEWGLAIEAPPAAELDERTETLVASASPGPGQPAADDEAAGQPGAPLPRASTPRRCSAPCSTASRATPPRATRSSSSPPREGFRAAVRARDEPFGDLGPSTFKG